MTQPAHSPADTGTSRDRRRGCFGGPQRRFAQLEDHCVLAMAFPCHQAQLPPLISPQLTKKLETNMTGSGRKHPLAAITAAYPDWRFWRTSSGELAARKGGTPPPRPHARGAKTAAEPANPPCRTSELAATDSHERVARKTSNAITQRG